MEYARASGLLCHITSLPSAYGMGDLGPAAYQWIDFLAESRQRWWQVLPVGPPVGDDRSPYRPASAFAGHPLLISPELLADDGWLSKADLAVLAETYLSRDDRVDAAAVQRARATLLDRATHRFLAEAGRGELDRFRAAHASWLEPFVRMRTAGKAGDPDELARHETCLQYFFEQQWQRLREYGRARGVRIFGDVPFYVDEYSADVRSHPALFKLGNDGRATALSGVPPDAFSATGQLWGNPVYDWEAHARDGYSWWVARIRRSLEWFDLVRLDHFRAFAAHWEVPAGSTNAVHGTWVPGPGRALLDAIAAACPVSALVAEDLGIITADVRELMHAYGLPGMKVLQFAFDSDGGNEHAPHYHLDRAVVYTGTHDNNTARGWFEHDASPAARARLSRYLGRECSPPDVSEALVRMAMGSVCRLAILPVQDVLGLDASARMNRPATPGGNWLWRLEGGQLTPQLAQHLADMTETYGRT